MQERVIPELPGSTNTDRCAGNTRVEPVKRDEASSLSEVRHQAARRSSSTNSPPRNTQAAAAPDLEPSLSVMSNTSGKIDDVDEKLHQYLDQYPAFHIEINKVKKGW